MWPPRLTPREQVENGVNASNKIVFPKQQLIGREQACRHLPDRCPRALALAVHIPKGFRLPKIQPPPQQPLRSFDHRSYAQSVLRIPGLLPQDPILPEAGLRNFDRGAQFSSIRRPHKIGKDSGLLGASDKACGRVANEQDERDGVIGEYDPGGLDPASWWEVLTEQDKVRLRSPRRYRSRVAILDDAEDLVAHATEMRCDPRRDGIPLLGNKDPQVPHNRPRCFSDLSQ